MLSADSEDNPQRSSAPTLGVLPPPSVVPETGAIKLIGAVGVSFAGVVTGLTGPMQGLYEGLTGPLKTRSQRPPAAPLMVPTVCRASRIWLYCLRIDGA